MPEDGYKDTESDNSPSSGSDASLEFDQYSDSVASQGQMDEATYFAMQQSTPITNNSGKRATQGRISLNSQKLLSL